MGDALLSLDCGRWSIVKKWAVDVVVYVTAETAEKAEAAASDRLNGRDDAVDDVAIWGATEIEGLVRR